MKSGKKLSNPVRALLVVLLFSCWPIYMSAQATQETQQSGQTEASSPGTPATPDQQDDNSKAAKPETNQPASPEDPRQAQFIADSQKLYQLAQELKAEVAKSNKNTLSIAVTKKAEEIEKLAKSLKERMRKE